MKFSRVTEPMPSQFVKESTTEATVGPQINSRSRVSGTPTIKAIRILSRRVRSVYRRLRRVATSAPASGASCARAGATPVVVLATSQIICPLLLCGQRVPERLHLALEAGCVLAWIREELQQEALHAVRA